MEAEDLPQALQDFHIVQARHVVPGDPSLIPGRADHLAGGDGVLLEMLPFVPDQGDPRLLHVALTDVHKRTGGKAGLRRPLDPASRHGFLCRRAPVLNGAIILNQIEGKNKQKKLPGGRKGPAAPPPRRLSR